MDFKKKFGQFVAKNRGGVIAIFKNFYIFVVKQYANKTQNFNLNFLQ